MSFLSIFTDKILGSIPKDQKNGMEEAMLGIAGAAGAVGVAVQAARAITPELAHLAQSVASNVHVLETKANFLTTPGDGMSKEQGMSMSKR